MYYNKRSLTKKIKLKSASKNATSKTNNSTQVLSSASPSFTENFRNMKETGIFLHLAETFQALGDSSRVQIIWALSHRDQNVNQLVEILDMSQPAISHHLRTLRNLHLVKVTKKGRESLYSLDDEHIFNLLHEGIDHVEDLLP